MSKLVVFGGPDRQMAQTFLRATVGQAPCKAQRRLGAVVPRHLEDFWFSWTCQGRFPQVLESEKIQ